MTFTQRSTAARGSSHAPAATPPSSAAPYAAPSSTNPAEAAREILTDGVHAAFIGSAVYAGLTLLVIVLGVRPWNRRGAVL